MTNTRKFLVTLLSIVMCLMLSFAMVACGGGEDGDGAGNNGDGSKLSKEQFNTAIDLSATSYKCESVTTANIIFQGQTSTSSLQAISTYVPGKLHVALTTSENGVTGASQENYYEKSGNNYFIYHVVDGNWERIADENGEDYLSTLSNTQVAALLAMCELTYDDLTYDEADKTYKYTNNDAEAFCKAFAIKFVNGKPSTVTLTTLAMGGVEGTIEMQANFSYSNVSVNLPTIVHVHKAGEVLSYFDTNQLFAKKIRKFCD